MKEAGETNHDHACITPTTGFILADIERSAEGCEELEKDGGYGSIEEADIERSLRIR